MSYKHLFLLPVLLLLWLSPVLAFKSPGQSTGFINDYADILTEEQEVTLETKLNTLAASEGSEMAVVTVDDLAGDTIENYAVSLFAEWGIGKKDKDNGLLLLIAMEERAMRIEVGYGLEGTITDAQAYWIIRDIITPAFKNEDYYTGISGAIDKVTEAITGSTVLPSAEETLASTSKNDSLITTIMWLFIFLIPILGITRSFWLGGVIGLVLGYILGNLLWGEKNAILGAVILGFIGLLFDYILSRGRSGGGSGGSFRGGGGRSSGGSGGFGGGRSGGGGASGRW